MSDIHMPQSERVTFVNVDNEHCRNIVGPLVEEVLRESEVVYDVEYIQDDPYYPLVPRLTVRSGEDVRRYHHQASIVFHFIPEWRSAHGMEPLEDN